MKPNQITVVVTGLVVLFLILFDFFMLTFYGADATISVQVNEWAFATHPLMVFGLGSIVGGLFVHFLRWSPKYKQSEV